MVGTTCASAEAREAIRIIGKRIGKDLDHDVQPDRDLLLDSGAVLTKLSGYLPMAAT